eukprot:2780710-Rhodomonas_salina.1
MASIFSWTGLDLQPGMSCHCRLQVWDSAHHSQIFESTGVIIDGTSPSPSFQTRPWVIDIETGMAASYSFSEAEACIARNEIAVFEGASIRPVLPFQTSNLGWVTLSGSWLREGGHYRLLLRSVDCVGKIGSTFSSNVGVDTTAPTPIVPPLCQNPFRATCFLQRDTERSIPIQCADTGSGPGKAIIGVRSARQSFPKHEVLFHSDANVSFALDVSQLISGTKYTMEIECQDVAGNSQVGNPHHFQVDSTAPRIRGEVFDGPDFDFDAAVLPVSAIFSGTWATTFEEPESRISHYSIGLSTRSCLEITFPDLVEFFPWKETRGSFSLPSPLKENQTFFLFVSAMIVGCGGRLWYKPSG